MKNVNVLILDREDLNRSAYEKRASRLSLTDFQGTPKEVFQTFVKEQMIIFVDKNGETRILKNRWGDDGKVIRKRGSTIPKKLKTIKKYEKI